MATASPKTLKKSFADAYVLLGKRKRGVLPKQLLCWATADENPDAATIEHI